MVEVPGQDWREVAKRYRLHVFGVGVEKGYGPDGRPMRAGVTEERLKEVLSAGGELSRAEMLRCRVRYLADGAVLGRKEFVETVYRRNRKKFGLTRKTGARKMKHVDMDGLCSMRDLRRDIITVPVIDKAE